MLVLKLAAHQLCNIPHLKYVPSFRSVAKVKSIYRKNTLYARNDRGIRRVLIKRILTPIVQDKLKI